ncbi:hypothetical protein SPRG_07062 [Saprolegnia parasitica CBS 223.65]|uniref:Uncharacterized protein n=1 Tax=Saprolegnia parasitica (strain CBS 223.65) TaxID=695850 RepID=A0A067CAD6_SAPPC|nr:hypothetical protein SPRG_07062 [Saprolegnia parasitica CBS 223.65]KDO27473.1 hypothetical protein SPRG_07062 [Saprolegnia parasitica CBS 223.65]|eukprot:XP_012201910.1 hypothetical protein SPRG_07062 [Saprolegnia parasitica CBS 223.65]
MESIKAMLVAGNSKGEDPTDLREPHVVEKVLSDEVDGAWADGKAPIEMITTFLGHLEDEETEEALALAQQILAHEPENQLIKNLQTALQLKLVVDSHAEAHDSSESSDDEDEDGDDEDEDEDTDDDGEDNEAMLAEAKDVEL